MGERADPAQTALIRTVEAAGVHNPRLLDAFRRVRRDMFVPQQAVATAYQDGPIPIGQDQLTSQPTLVAAMIAALHLSGDEQALEIGTGLGFQTALLAQLARRVYSIERHADLARQARDNLAAAPAYPSTPRSRPSSSRPPHRECPVPSRPSCPRAGGWCSRSAWVAPNASSASASGAAR